MENARHFTRGTCAERCELQFTAAAVSATVRNYSLTGLYVQLDAPAGPVRPGDRCRVCLCSDRSVPCPCELSCEVVRIEANDLALRYVNTDEE